MHHDRSMAGGDEDVQAFPERSRVSSGGFGDPRRAMPGNVRRRGHPGQTAFQWGADAAAPPPSKVETPTLVIGRKENPPVGPAPLAESDASPSTVPKGPPITPTSQKMGAGSPALLAAKRPFRETVERYLRDQGVPYINVDEAKKALFAGAKLRSFHFVVYRPDSLNWLLWAAQLRKESRQDLVEWQKIFGDGFVAVVAKQMKDASLKFRTVAGEVVELK